MGLPQRLVNLEFSIANTLEDERERWFNWVPVLFGAGILGYFALPVEPSAVTSAAILLAVLALRICITRGTLLTAMAGAVACVGIGFVSVHVRTEITRAPVVTQAGIFSVISGWVERVQNRNNKGYRMTLRVARIEGVNSENLPRRLWINFRKLDDLPLPAAPISVRVILRPPPGPVVPGGYDFARRAWFQQLGGVGIGVGAPVEAGDIGRAPLVLRLQAAIQRMRDIVTARLRAGLGEKGGHLAAALITGDRGGMPEALVDALRSSGLAHILAISGMHMGMISGAVYWLLRAVLALVPVLALRYRIRNWAAGMAMVAASYYLLLSGASVSTQRAYVMIAVMLGAIVLNRPAISLRNVALAALIILALAPENILDVGFQMSFAATTCLVAAYEALAQRRRARLRTGPASRAWRLVLGLGGILFTTAIAGLAIAPLAAFHFHRLAQFSIAANLFAIPILTFIVMPMALISLVAMPLGLEGAPLLGMQFGLNWISSIALTVASWHGAVRHLPSISPVSLGLMIAGLIWFVLWRTRWRIWGGVVFASGLAMTVGTDRPDIWIGRNGNPIAIRLNDGLLSPLSRRGGRYSLERWLEADGDGRAIADIPAGRGFLCDAHGCTARVKGRRIAIANHPAAFDEDCQKSDIIIARFRAVRACQSATIVIDQRALAVNGVHALTIADGRVFVRTAGAMRGHRPWTVRTPVVSPKVQRTVTSKPNPGVASSDE